MSDRMPPTGERPVLAIVTAVDEYQRRVLAAARRRLADHGIPLLVHCDGPFVRGAASPLLVDILESNLPRGVLCIDALAVEEQEDLLALLARIDLPTIHIGTEGSGSGWVRGDNSSGMRELMAHVLDERGARRPVLVRGKEYHPDSAARERVFREELQRRGLPVDEDLIVTGYFEPEVTADAMYGLLTRRRDFDAVVALNDQMALSVVSVLLDSGFRIPQQVAVSGFDNDAAARSWPGLTSVDQGLEEQGERAADLLLDRIAGAARVPGVVVASRLVERASTGPADRPLATSFEEADRMARTQRHRLAAQDLILAMGHALDHCWTVDDVVEALGTHLPRVGVTRAFLALYERAEVDEARLISQVDVGRARVELDLRDGAPRIPPPGFFETRAVLPAELRQELDRGVLVVQPLAVLDRPCGYIVFEQTGGSDRLPELLRIDLSRALDGVLTSQEVHAHALRLERVVARRTAELQAEVVTRRRAERELQAANTELQRSAMLDGLTQIPNRMAFAGHLERHWDVQRDAEDPLALLMVDVDAFKPYNDHYGHLLGDDALRTVASCLHRAVRGEDDLVCRYGGEEFAVVLPRSAEHAAVAVAQRFQALLAEAAVEHVTSPVSPVLTASIGIAVGVPTAGDDPEDLLHQADLALYRAKSLGRDRIELGGADEGVAADGYVTA